MKLRTVSVAECAQICARIDAGTASRHDLKTAAIHFLALLVERAPGSSVEVRVPPFGVAQCLSGSRHTRGTPPAVVEMDAHTWIGLARGILTWEQCLTGDPSGRGIRASGQRSDLSAVLPLI